MISWLIANYWINRQLFRKSINHFEYFFKEKNIKFSDSNCSNINFLLYLVFYIVNYLWVVDCWLGQKKTFKDVILGFVKQWLTFYRPKN